MIDCKVIAITLLPLKDKGNIDATCIHLNMSEADVIEAVEGNMSDMHRCYCAYVTVELTTGEAIETIRANGCTVSWLNDKETLDTGFVIVDRHLDPVDKPPYWDTDNWGDWKELHYFDLIEKTEWLLRL